MDDLISKKTVIEAIEKNACNTQRIFDAVEQLPPAEPKRGKWNNIVDGIEYSWGTCDTCGARIPMAYKYYEYCPHCGSRNEVTE